MIKRRKRALLKREDAIIINEGRPTHATEGYNRLKDNILFASDNGKYKVLQIESSVQSEGKTTVSCNLGVSLGQNEKKVVIIDLDFRKAKVHHLFELPNEQGFAEYMLGKIPLKDAIQTTKYKNVDIISRGGKIHNSSLVLTSDRFKAMIKDLRKTYDFVILDTAPVLQISDYIHISKVSDCTIFLVAFASTRKGQVREAIRELRKNNVNVIGTVFTYYDRKAKNDYGYGYYYYYYQTDDGVEKRKRKKKKEIKEDDKD